MLDPVKYDVTWLIASVSMHSSTTRRAHDVWSSGPPPPPFRKSCFARVSHPPSQRAAAEAVRAERQRRHILAAGGCSRAWETEFQWSSHSGHAPGVRRDRSRLTRGRRVGGYGGDTKCCAAWNRSSNRTGRKVICSVIVNRKEKKMTNKFINFYLFNNVRCLHKKKRMSVNHWIPLYNES